MQIMHEQAESGELAILSIFFEESDCENIQIMTEATETEPAVLLQDETDEATVKCLEKRSVSEALWNAMDIPEDTDKFDQTIVNLPL